MDIKDVIALLEIKAEASFQEGLRERKERKEAEDKEGDSSL